MVRGPVNVRLRPYHLSYGIELSHGGFIVGLYVLAVCGTLLLSSRRRIVTFGIINVVAIGIIAWLTVDGFASVWCGWAAVASGAIALHIRVGRSHRMMTVDTSAA
jgi:cytochrome b561